MRSALYYPHTEINSEEVMKTALLLWDELHAIAPWDGYRRGIEARCWGKPLRSSGLRTFPTRQKN
jgi:hypothetical protein